MEKYKKCEPFLSKSFQDLANLIKNKSKEDLNISVASEARTSTNQNIWTKNFEQVAL